MGKRWEGFKRWMNTVPNCPSCEGRGSNPKYGYEDIVWWKGQQEWVCGHCKGAGKV